MTATCYVTFGQRYRHETHPVDDRAHPDGWFEYQATPGADASDAARRRLLLDHRRVQHRDARPPWCKACGLTADGCEPAGLLDKDGE